MRRSATSTTLILFEDNCESLGASLNGQLVRHLRRHQHVQHLLLPSHLDDGGRAARDRRHRDRAPGARDSQSRLGARPAGRHRSQSRPEPRRPFFEAYRFVVPGYNVRPLEICGAVGLEQLKKLDAHARDPPRERGAVRAAVRGRRAVHHPARARPQLVVQLHDHPESGDAASTAARDGRDAQGGHRLPHDYRRLLSCATKASSSSTTTSSASIVNANIAHDHGFFVGNHPRDLTAEISSCASAGPRHGRRR